jgi:hypothetical protein
MRGARVIWWCKVRRLHLLAGSLAMYFALSLLTRDTVVVLPDFLSPGGGAQMLLPTFFSVLPAVGLIACLESRVAAPEITGVRRIGTLDLGLSVATVVAATLLGFVVAWWSGDMQTAAGGRNSAFLVGLALAVRSVAGGPAVMAPVLWPLIVAFFGFHGRGRPYHWTVLPEPHNVWYAAVGAALAFAVGLAAQSRTARKTT